MAAVLFEDSRASFRVAHLKDALFFKYNLQPDSQTLCLALSSASEDDAMIVEFYKHGAKMPDNFDIFMHENGQMSFDRTRATKGLLRVIVELKNHRPNAHQTSAMFDLIRKHKVCTVAFHNFDG